jgi:hypothetical protein
MKWPKSTLMVMVIPWIVASPSFADDAFDTGNPIKLGFKDMLKLVRDNVNGWTHLALDDDHKLWTPHSFYTEQISDPKKWVAQIKELGFCQPDKAWKSFPVVSVSNDQIADNFGQIAAQPNLAITSQLSYTEMVIVGGKARTVSYDYAQNGPMVNVTCSARNELGDVQSISQNIDVRDPKKFEVKQKKNGKLLEI